VIGGNVWLTESVPPFSVVYQKSEVKIRDRSEMKNVIEFMI
jgi:serine O-acetyltransferase